MKVFGIHIKSCDINNYKQTILISFLSTLFIFIIGYIRYIIVNPGLEKAADYAAWWEIPILLVTCGAISIFRKGLRDMLHFMLPVSKARKYWGAIANILLASMVAGLSVPMSEALVHYLALLICPAYALPLGTCSQGLFETLRETPGQLLIVAWIFSVVIVFITLVRSKLAAFIMTFAILFLMGFFLIPLVSRYPAESAYVFAPLIVIDLIVAFGYYKRWQPANSGVFMV